MELTITKRDAAARRGVSIRTLERYVRRGRIVAYLLPGGPRLRPRPGRDPDGRRDGELTWPVKPTVVRIHRTTRTILSCVDASQLAQMLKTAITTSTTQGFPNPGVVGSKPTGHAITERVSRPRVCCVRLSAAMPG